MKLSQSLSEDPSDSSRLATFIRMATNFCLEAKALGCRIVPSHNSFRKFGSLDRKKQEEIIKTFSLYYTVLMSVQAKGAALRDSLSTTWWAIRELGLRPPSDLFDQLEKDDVFEIYDPDHIQIYRSINFFYLTSYSLEDIFCYSWPELYSRSEFITEGMIEGVTKVFTGNADRVVKTNFPLHVVVDKFSPGKEWGLIRHRLFAPLKSGDGKVFLFNAFKVLSRKEVQN